MRTPGEPGSLPLPAEVQPWLVLGCQSGLGWAWLGTEVRASSGNGWGSPSDPREDLGLAGTAWESPLCSGPAQTIPSKGAAESAVLDGPHLLYRPFAEVGRSWKLLRLTVMSVPSSSPKCHGGRSSAHVCEEGNAGGLVSQP